MSQKPAREKGQRRYTSLACLNCRKKKIKCNNERPRCSNCNLYDNECIYGQDRRRASSTIVPPTENVNTVSSSDALQASENVQGGPTTQSEAALSPDAFVNLLPPLPGGPQPEFDTEFSQTIPLDDDWSYWAYPDENTQLFANSTINSSHDFSAFATNDSIEPVQDLDGLKFDDYSLQHSSANRYLSSDPESPEIFGVRTNPQPLPVAGEVRPAPRQEVSGSALDDVTKQLTSRLGRLQMAEDGRPRYYGATSNLHLLSGAGSLTQPNIRHVFVHGDAAIASAGLQWEADPDLETHLINLFFAWHNNLQFPVDKAIFLRERQRFREGHRTDLFSPALENAVLCIGAAYTDRTHSAISGAVDEFFALRTKAYLDIEIDSPTIATAQSLLVLSSHEAAHTRESRGWIYMGMVVNIISDLGLHLDLEQEYARLESDSSFEDMTIVRRNLFWTVKSIDTLWSAYSGRPSTMKNLVSSQQEPLPSRTYEWEFYIDKHSKMNFPNDLDPRAAAYVHIHLASLMVILARVGEVLYSGVPDVLSDTQAFVRTADRDFASWYTSLPANMTIDLSKHFQVQGVLELHLIYHECIILLHRPFITPVESASAQGIKSDKQTAELSLSKCVASANEICAIMVHYRDRYGLKRLHHQMVHAAMTAALIHAYQLCTAANGSDENKKAQASFLTCIQALGEMGQTFKSASRALEVVTSLQQSWRDDTAAGDRFKRARLR